MITCNKLNGPKIIKQKNLAIISLSIKMTLALYQLLQGFKSKQVCKNPDLFLSQISKEDKYLVIYVCRTVKSMAIFV